MQYMQNSQAVNRQEPDDGYVFAKIPPHNVEAEQGILGCLMMWNDALDDVPSLDAWHFHEPLHRGIFQQAVDLIRAGRKANPVTLSPFFKDAPSINPDQTAVQYLGFLGVNACMRSSLRDYARLIIDLSTRRSLILVGEELTADAYEMGVTASAQGLIEQVEGHLFALAEGSKEETSKTSTFDQAKALAVERATSGEVTGLSTGLEDLDKKLGGLFPSDLIILAGRPSMGKTALATDIAVHVASKGTPVGFFSLEMSATQLAMRVLSQRAEVPSDKFRNCSATQSQFAKLKSADTALNGLPLWIDETGGIPIGTLAVRARHMLRKHKIGLIVVDYLQLMQGTKRRENRVQDITEITTGLKAIAKDLNVPVVALSQLSRNVEHRADKRPQLSDLRESGSIEQDADVVMFVFREDYYIERDEPTLGTPDHPAWQKKLAESAGKAEVIIGKQRHGAVGTVKLAFHSELTRFSNLAKGGDNGL